MSEDMDRECTETVLDVVLHITSRLEGPDVLDRIVRAAREVTGARYSAMAILDSQDSPSQFVYSGIDPEVAALMEHPKGRGLLGAIDGDEPLVLDDVHDHPSFGGLPPHHPALTSFLGVAIKVNGRVHGRLYLANKEGGFTDTDTQAVLLLATAAANAIRTAELFRVARLREQWLSVGQEVTTAMLEGADVEDALALIAARLRAVAEADAACLVLPGVGDDWVIEIADGDAVGDLVGIVMPQGGRALTVRDTRSGMVVNSFARTSTLRVPEFGRYGPALYAPLVVGQECTGVLILLRARGMAEFTDEELTIAESFAEQAALTLELATARGARDRATLLDERSRIARDLHDLAIQQLFATGLSIAHARDASQGQVAADLTSALDGIDDAVSQIRSIVHALRRAGIPAGLCERLEREVALARIGLGFSPALDLVPDRDSLDDWAQSVEEDLVDDVVAVVREGLANAARHARADAVGIRVDLAERLSVCVTDDGVGLPSERERNSGLRNLAARARRWGGDLHAELGDQGVGTTLTWFTGALGSDLAG